MKNAYHPEAQNDRIFTFLGDPDGILIIAYVIIFVVLITLIVLMIRKKERVTNNEENILFSPGNSFWFSVPIADI